MTQSPPKAPQSSRPPRAPGGGAAGRLSTALAAGGSVLALSTIAVVLWPRTYSAEATFAVDAPTPVTNPAQLAGRIEAVLLERQELAGVAVELPPELRSPDPIGRLRAGIRVQSRGGVAYVVEFHGSNRESVQRITNRLAERAVALLPQLAAAPGESAPAQALAQRTRAVTEFLTAHPEVNLDAAGSKPNAAADSGLEALRTEKRQIELRLATGANDNPYSDPGQSPEILNRRLAEIKSTIARREKALKEPHPAAPVVAPELVAEWRGLLADLAAAQAAANIPSAAPPVTGHIVARAPLPTTPLTPNRLVLGAVALLLSAAAAMAAYALPRFGESDRRKPRGPGARSDPPPAPKAPEPLAHAHEPAPRMPEPGRVFEPAPRGFDTPRAGEATQPSDAPPAPRPFSEQPPPHGSEPPKRPAGSEPPGPIAAQRPVVVGPRSSSAPPPGQNELRGKTAIGGLEGPAALAAASTGAASPAPRSAHSPPAAPLFGSRPPPGAGAYSVSSSHPPAMEGTSGARNSVERLSPLQSARPPAASGPPSRRAPSPSPSPQAAPPPQIVSLPPALDPQAETWAARFETPPPPPDLEAVAMVQAPLAPAAAAPEPAVATPTAVASPVITTSAEATSEEPPPKRAGRWKTQVMGSMVPLEVQTARDARPVESQPPESLDTQPLAAPAPTTASLATVPRAEVIVQPAHGTRRQAPTPAASTIIQQDMPFGWQPRVDAPAADVATLRDAVLKQVNGRKLTLLVTGSASGLRAQIACALSLALAEAGARVLLVEADFDSPAVHHALGFTAPPGAGFSQQLMARRNARHPEPWVAMRCSANLQVMGEGRFRSPGLVNSREFERAILELREQHQLVIVHAPALTRIDDLRALGPLAQGVAVVRMGQASRLYFGDDPLRALLSGA